MPRFTQARVFSLSVMSVLFLLGGCGDDPAPAVTDRGQKDPDGAALDLGARADTGGDDAGAVDRGETDSGTTPDTGPGDMAPGDAADGSGSDAEDGAQGPDASDAAIDSGVVIPDQDGDSISDADEGNGAVDTNLDGEPDSLDPDSDGDGILDSVEAGDANPATPPIDTNNDGTPDFRDLDSDGDGIDDSVEGSSDPDLDQRPNFVDPDSDGDGILDSVEGNVQSDADGTANFLDLDSDGDGISDQIEGTGDPDGDATPNYLDDDSDGDGILDSVELVANPDNDALPAFIDLDSDGDGINDSVEGTADLDLDTVGNWLDLDSDADNISDLHEGVGNVDNDAFPNYLDPDSDGDGASDLEEAGDSNLFTPPRDYEFDGTADFLDTDSDGDRISDADEGSVNSDTDSLIDRLDIDSDDDGLLDILEAGDALESTPPVQSDGDGTPDFRDTDSDNDTILDISDGSGNPDNDALANYRDPDSDGDGVTDAVEAGDTNPLTAPVDTDSDTIRDFLDLDSDGDALGDSVEPGCPAGSSRLLSDSDADGFLDPAEVAYGSNPCSAASIIDDFYFVLPPLGPGDDAPLVFSDTAIDSADVAINMDTSCSMGGEATNVRNSLSNTIIPGVDAVIPNAAFGVASFEDYPVFPFGDTPAGDRPFRLGTRMTTDNVVAQAAVNALTIRNGIDLPESGIESLYQVATGFGTAWTGGTVPAFNPALNLVPGVADGNIGGVGFRGNSLPIVVHVTDAFSHERPDYQAVSPAITAAATTTVRTALSSIGARVVTIANTNLPRDPFRPICSRTSHEVYGEIQLPVGTDADWFVLNGVTAGQTVVAEIFSRRREAATDMYLAIFDANGELAFNDDIVLNVNVDSRISLVIPAASTPPYYVAVTMFDDRDFNGTGGQASDFYFLDVRVNGALYSTQITQCRSTDDGNNRAAATPLVPFASSMAPANFGACMANCELQMPPFTLPYGISEATGALIPACAWDQFGGARPAGCALNQCCTGLNGAGEAVNAQSLCPLAFKINAAGTGIDQAIVTGIEALVRFSTFTITTVLRGDPVELAASGIDTRCFVQSIIPTSATPPNACAPVPTLVDLFPPSPQLDSFQNVVPGTILEFQVDALNQNMSTGLACAPALPQPRLFRAFIDVVADGVTIVDTRDVIIIVPPLPPGGGN